MAIINCENINSFIKVDILEIKKNTGMVMRCVKKDSYGVNILLVSAQKIRAFNRKYLRDDRSTDCLAFGEGSGFSHENRRRFLGDIVISLDAARKNSKIYALTFKEEMYLYIIHSILHLTGYNDNNDYNRKKMRKKEYELLQKIRKYI